MTKRGLLLTCVALMSLLTGLVWTVPAGLVWKQALPLISKRIHLPVAIRGVAGTLPRGQVMIQAQSVPMILAWQLMPSGLFHLNELVRLSVRTSGGEVWVRAGAERLSTPWIDAEGDVDLGSFNHLLARYRLRLSGNLNIRKLYLKLNPDTGLPIEARGQLSWAGGPVQYPAGSQLQTADMPPLKGTVTGRDGEIMLSVSTLEDQPVMHIRLDGVGTAHISVLKRLVDLAGAPWPNQVAPDTEIFKLRQRLM